MEPEIREFFRRVLLSICLLIIWMAVNMVAGVKFSLAFYEDKIQWYNIVFYIWVIASLAAAIFAYRKIWKDTIEHLKD
ncbi:MAG: hypothetical protein ABJB05_00630 [Parafilimonas sp.]